MHLTHYPVDKIKQDLLHIIGQHLDLGRYQVFFFGSRVTGQSGERSDIDVGIEGPSPVPSPVMTELRAAIEQVPTLYKIDLVDFKQVSPRFRQVAGVHRELIT